jgi:hypothetical protein
LKNGSGTQFGDDRIILQYWSVSLRDNFEARRRGMSKAQFAIGAAALTLTIGALAPAPTAKAQSSDMRGIMITILAGIGIGIFGSPTVLAAPANGAATSEAAAVGQMIEKARRYRNYSPRRRALYYTYGPYERADPSGGISLHQLSQENQERAQQNSGIGGH